VETDETAGTGGEPATTGDGDLTPAQLAALEAAKAAKKARKTQRKAQEQAERARRLAEEYARLAEQDDAPAAPTVSVSQSAEPIADDSGTDADTDVTQPDGAPEPKPEPAARSRVPIVTAAIVLAACLAFVVAAVVVFATRDNSSGSNDANVRDTVLQQARQDIVVLNTMDYRDVDAGLKRWADASTGTLHNQVVRATAVEKQHLTQAKSVASAKVVAAAITSLDVADGSASIIASVDVTVKHSDGKSNVNRERLKGQMTRVGSVWKVGSLGQVPVSSP
jgi:Mce-associated membrane protein